MSFEAATKPQKKNTPIRVSNERQGVLNVPSEAEDEAVNEVEGDLRGPPGRCVMALALNEYSTNP